MSATAKESTLQQSEKETASSPSTSANDELAVGLDEVGLAELEPSSSISPIDGSALAGVDHLDITAASPLEADEPLPAEGAHMINKNKGGTSNQLVSPFTSPDPLPSPTNPAVSEPASSNSESRLSRTRTVDQADAMNMDLPYDAANDGPQRKKQRRVTSPPPLPSNDHHTHAAQSTAAIPSNHVSTTSLSKSVTDVPSDIPPLESRAAIAAVSNSTSSSSQPPAPSQSFEPIVIDDDDTEMPQLERSASANGSFLPFSRGDQDGTEGVIDLTADEPTAARNIPPRSSAPSSSFHSAHRPQSIAASLFSTGNNTKSSMLPASQYNPYAPTNNAITKPFAPSFPSLLPSTSLNAPMKVESKPAPPSNSVDLRDNSDDDASSDNKFGTILCNVYGVKMCPGKAQPKEIVTLTRIRTGADPNAIRVDNTAQQPCGVLSKDVAAALAPLIDKNHVRVEAKVGTSTPTEMGLRVDLYGRSSEMQFVETHLRMFPMVQYLSSRDPVLKKAQHSGLESFLQQHGSSAAAAAGQPTYVNEFGETVVGYAPHEQGVSVREIENDLDCLFGHEIDLASMPLAETPACLRTYLHPYQRQGLAWMIQHEERRTMNVEGKNELMMGWSKQVNQNGEVSFVNKLSKEVQAEPPELARGGLLADEMGLGKSLTTLALIASTLNQNVGGDTSQSAKLSSSLKPKAHNLKRIAPTLIVCPLSVITNWEQQILHHFNPNHMPRYYIYHGPNRVRDVAQLRQYDILITTYNILSQEYDISCEALGAVEESESDEDELSLGALKKKPPKKSKNKSKIDAAHLGASAASQASLLGSAESEGSEVRRAPLFVMEFFRIVLDEAHVIRERGTLQSRAARALRGERRWALSGTPLVNKVDDAFALLSFIKVPPFTSYAMWQRIVLRPLKSRDPKGMQRLQQIMSTICLRRRKNEEINGKPILVLPEKTQRTRYLTLTGNEKVLYDTLAESGRSQFNRLVRDGSVLSHYAFVLEILLRMRQACDHSMLVPQHYHSKGFSELASSDRKSEIIRLANLLEDGLADECGICHKVVDDPVITQCAHYMCKGCMDSYIQNPSYHNAVYRQQSTPGPPQPPDHRLYCPNCRLPIEKSLIVSMHHKELVKLEQEQQQAALLHSKGHVTLSPKLLALLEELQLVLNRGDKAVIFSQWTSFLNILQATLNQASVRHVRLDGQMSASNRSKALKSFEDDDSVKVFLISLKAGGVGLNLTAASTVFMLDPWWSPAIEDQAVDRVHRLGQTKNVEVVRFICKDSVEEKIMELQDAKRQMSQTALTRSSKSKEAQQADRLQDLLHLFK